MSVDSNQLASLPAHRDPNCFCLILIAFVITCTSGTTWAGIKSLTP